MHFKYLNVMHFLLDVAAGQHTIICICKYILSYILQYIGEPTNFIQGNLLRGIGICSGAAHKAGKQLSTTSFSNNFSLLHFVAFFHVS